MRAKKHLGQNFLKSHSIVKTMVVVAKVSKADTVLEIGPGKGVLTGELLKMGASVIAVEKDEDLLPFLQNSFPDEINSGQLILLNKDILNTSVEKLGLTKSNYKLVANIPYYITGEIMRFFFSSKNQPLSITFMVQKEVAQRIVAKDGKESILSLSVKLYGKPTYIKKVPARYFSPKPKVDSAIIHIDNITRNNLTKKQEANFFFIIKKGFLHKRKLLVSNLKGDINEKQFHKCNIPINARAEDIKLKQWFCLSSKKIN